MFLNRIILVTPFFMCLACGLVTGNSKPVDPMVHLDYSKQKAEMTDEKAIACISDCMIKTYANWTPALPKGADEKGWYEVVKFSSSQEGNVTVSRGNAQRRDYSTIKSVTVQRGPVGLMLFDVILLGLIDPFSILDYHVVLETDKGKVLCEAVKIGGFKILTPFWLFSPCWESETVKNIGAAFDHMREKSAQATK